MNLAVEAAAANLVLKIEQDLGPKVDVPFCVAAVEATATVEAIRRIGLLLPTLVGPATFRDQGVSRTVRLDWQEKPEPSSWLYDTEIVLRWKGDVGKWWCYCVQHVYVAHVLAAAD